MNSRNSQETDKLLKVIIGLLIRNEVDRPAALKEQIIVLSKLGLSPSNIAEILGRSSNHINKELSWIRKGIRNKGNK